MSDKEGDTSNEVFKNSNREKKSKLTVAGGETKGWEDN